jgi:preprotein translocase subunit SecE
MYASAIATLQVVAVVAVAVAVAAAVDILGAG